MTAYFRDEGAARAYLESRRWPNGPVCPHCSASGTRIGRLRGKTTRAGLYKCYGCRRPFTVKIGTVFESSHVGLHLWLQAVCLLSSDDGTTTIRELEEILGVVRKTAWLMKRQICERIAKENPVFLKEERDRAWAVARPNSPAPLSAPARQRPEALEAAVGKVVGEPVQPPPQENQLFYSGRNSKSKSRRVRHHPDQLGLALK